MRKERFNDSLKISENKENAAQAWLGSSGRWKRYTSEKLQVT